MKWEVGEMQLTNFCQLLFVIINYFSVLQELLLVCSKVDVEFVINVTFTARWKRTTETVTECKLHVWMSQNPMYLYKLIC